MKRLILSAFTIRRRLISSGRSLIPTEWARKEMNRIEHWLATGNAINIARKNETVLRVLIPGNFIKRFEEPERAANMLQSWGGDTYSGKCNFHEFDTESVLKVFEMFLKEL